LKNDLRLRNELEGNLARARRRVLKPADARTLERLAQLIKDLNLHSFIHRPPPIIGIIRQCCPRQHGVRGGFWTQLLQILLALSSNDLHVLLPKRDSRKSTL
jgi:hypothetical protein